MKRLVTLFLLASSNIIFKQAKNIIECTDAIGSISEQTSVRDTLDKNPKIIT